MNQMGIGNFNAYGRYYDLLYKDKDYQAEASYVQALIAAHCRDATTILELGAGSGAHAAYLCKQGYAVTGVERSAEMVEAARLKYIPGFSPIQADITDYSINTSFDVAISLFHVISYLTHNEDLLKAFTLTERHLRPGGIFIFDVWFTPAVLTQRPETRIKRLADSDVEITRIAEPVLYPARNVVDVQYEVLIRRKESHQVEVVTETHPMRHFSIPEVELVARLSGLELIKAEEFLTASPPTETTWGVCFILKKPDIL